MTDEISFNDIRSIPLFPYYDKITQRLTSQNDKPDPSSFISFDDYAQLIISQSTKDTPKQQRPIVHPQIDANNRLTGFIPVDLDDHITDIDIKAFYNVVLIAKSPSETGYHVLLYIPALNGVTCTPNEYKIIYDRALIESGVAAFAAANIAKTSDTRSRHHVLFVTSDPNAQVTAPRVHQQTSDNEDLMLLQKLPAHICDEEPQWWKVLAAFIDKYGDDRAVREALREWSKQSASYFTTSDGRQHHDADANFDRIYDTIVEREPTNDSTYTLASIRALAGYTSPKDKPFKRPFVPIANARAAILLPKFDPDPVLSTPSGHQPLFFQGTKNILVAKRGMRKTWLAMILTTQAARAGHPAIYYDLEMSHRVHGERLRTLGARPNDPWLQHYTIADRDDLDHIDGYRVYYDHFEKPPVVVYDSALATGMSGDGSVNNDAFTAEKIVTLLEPWGPEATTVALWHAAKDANEDHMSAVNSYASEATVDMVYKLVSSSDPDISILENTKDRHDLLNGQEVLAAVQSIREPIKKVIITDYTKQDKDQILHLDIIEYVSKNPGAKTQQIVDNVKGQTGKISATLKDLVLNETLVMDRVGNAKVYYVVDDFQKDTE